MEKDRLCQISVVKNFSKRVYCACTWMIVTSGPTQRESKTDPRPKVHQSETESRYRQ